jgi:hypothetical protein
MVQLKFLPKTWCNVFFLDIKIEEVQPMELVTDETPLFEQGILFTFEE